MSSKLQGVSNKTVMKVSPLDGIIVKGEIPVFPSEKKGIPIPDERKIEAPDIEVKSAHHVDSKKEYKRRVKYSGRIEKKRRHRKMRVRRNDNSKIDRFVGRIIFITTPESSSSSCCCCCRKKRIRLISLTL